MEIETLVELNFKITSKVMKDAEEISWHYIRKFCETDEECDKICFLIFKSLGIKIKYQGMYLKYDEEK